MIYDKKSRAKIESTEVLMGGNMRNIKISHLLIIPILIGIFSCGKKEVIVKAPIMSTQNPLMSGQGGNGESFNNDSTLDQYIAEESGHVTLKAIAQEHLFLMSSAVIQSAPTPSGRAQANKLVFFKKQGEMLNLFQSTLGQVSTESIKTMILIAEFPIIEEKDGIIKFDFRAGMNTLFQKGSYYISSSKTSGNEEALKITHSYLNKVELRGKFLFIDQMIRYNETSKGKTSNAPAQVKYVFSSYTKNKGFAPKVSDGMKRVGYFQNHKVITPGTGEENVYIMKFDMRKIHTYYLTSDIPKEFKQAVVDGIKYWNKVFGKVVFDVKELPKNIDVHEPNFNIIKWMKWDTAGFAYANMMSDPLTGETLQANVYMTSVFGLGGLKRAKRLMKKLILTGNGPKKLEKSAIVLSSNIHHSTKVCDTTKYQAKIKNNFIESVIRIDDLKADDAKKEEIYLRFAQDYVREVVAHEVGHTLGLRHNFAGNLKSNITPKNYEQIRNDYLLNDSVPSDIIPASTVMDYTPGILASIIGSFIRKSSDGLSYDKQAIEFGYTSIKADDMTIDVFCSDEVARSKKTHVDCRLFDQFPNVITSKHYTFKKQYEILALKLISKFDFLKNTTDTINVDEKLKKLRFTPEKDVISFLKDGLLPFLETFDTKAKYIGIDYTYPKNLSIFDKDEIDQKNQDYIATSLKSIGGLSEALFSDFKTLQTKSGDAIVQATNKLQSKTFEILLKNYGEELSKLSDDEKKLILEKLTKYFTRFEKEVLVYTLSVFEKQTFYKKETNFEKDMFEILAPIIMTKSRTTQIVSPNKFEVKLPYFEYKKNEKKDLRNLAVKVLMKDYFPKSGSYIRRMTSARQFVLASFLKEQEDATKGLEEKDLTDNLYDWMYYEMINFLPMRALMQQQAPKKKETIVTKMLPLVLKF